ncbi:hypothetical protein [Methanomassiliicoccus luminyensis]|uniref:hypothetical protein n=1 Tax=Methanomassiliicoccus luminyensis TaxID=1080712 RepID=UPI0011C941AE|nr:hypothetical protein [Methanomassiliicoccus luminyensis]
MSGLDDTFLQRLRCAYFVFVSTGLRDDHAEERSAWTSAAEELRETVSDFLERKVNFGTVKYRMDQAGTGDSFAFPSRAVSQAMSDLALGVSVDDLEPALRRAFELPEDLGEAKGRLLDFEAFAEDQVERGDLKRPQARPERWPELLSTVWHIQDPAGWPAASSAASRFLIENDLVEPLEPAQDYADLAAVMRDLSDALDLDLPTLDILFASVLSGELEMPENGDCFEATMRWAGSLDLAGQADAAIEAYEIALSIRPGTARALERKAELYQAKGLVMLAIGEAEALVELGPRDLHHHRRLLALYHQQKMVREYNIEVRRYKTLMASKQE